MSYRCLSRGDVRTYITQVRSGSVTNEQPPSFTKGAPPEIDDGFVGDLRRDLRGIRRSFGDRPTDAEGAAFEALAAPVVHRRIPAQPHMVADGEFWAWLAVVHFRDLIEWRYAAQPDHGSLANFGAANHMENFMFRLWLRADLVFDPDAQDPYHLATRGRVDFWRSHLFRQGYADSRTFARALLKFQYPYDDTVKPRLKTEQIRQLVRVLCRIRTNQCFELLTEQQCLELISATAAELATDTQRQWTS